MIHSLRRSTAARQLGRNNWKKRQTDSIVCSSSIFLDLPQREAQEKVEWKTNHHADSSSFHALENASNRVPFHLPLPPPSSSNCTLSSTEGQSLNSFVGLSSSELVALEDATKPLMIDLFQLNESRIYSSSEAIVSNSLRGGGGGSHRKRRNQERQYYDIPIQSPWLQQVAQFSTSPSPPDSSSSSSSVPPSLSVAARTAPRPAVSNKHKLDPTRIPTPPSGMESENPLESLKKTGPRSIVRKGVDMTVSAFTALLRFLFQLPGNVFYYLTHPTETRMKYAEMKQMVKDEIHHYWVGFKVRQIEMTRICFQTSLTHSLHLLIKLFIVIKAALGRRPNFPQFGSQNFARFFLDTSWAEAAVTNGIGFIPDGSV